MTSDLFKVGGGMVYGATRQMVSDKLAPITAKIPAGDYADEAVMGALGYLLMKGKVPFLNKVPFTRKIGEAAVYIESARIGAGFSSTFVPKVTGSTNGGALKATTF